MIYYFLLYILTFSVEEFEFLCINLPDRVAIVAGPLHQEEETHLVTLLFSRFSRTSNLQNLWGASRLGHCNIKFSFGSQDLTGLLTCDHVTHVINQGWAILGVLWCNTNTMVLVLV